MLNQILAHKKHFSLFVLKQHEWSNWLSSNKVWRLDNSTYSMNVNFLTLIMVTIISRDILVFRKYTIEYLGQAFSTRVLEKKSPQKMNLNDCFLSSPKDGMQLVVLYMHMEMLILIASVGEEARCLQLTLKWFRKKSIYMYMRIAML